MKRPTKTLLVLLALILWTAPPAGAYTLILQDGKPMSVKEFRIIGDVLQGTTMSGGPFAIRGEEIDFQATYIVNLEETREKGVYLARGKILTFDEIEVGESTATLILSDAGIITVPLETLDFRTTVIEGAGASRAGSKLKSPRSTSASRSTARTPPRPRIQPEPEETPLEAELRPEPDPAPVPVAPPLGQPTENPEERENDSFRNAFQGAGGDDAPGDSRQPTRRITRAEVVQKVDPVFDMELVPEGRGLTALMEVSVTTTGQVGNVKVIKSTGNPELDQAGIDAIRQYIYNPAEKDGVPFESRRLERISFRRPRN